MTTKVTVEANHGWPVRVTPKHINVGPGGAPAARVEIVPAGEARTFYVHSNLDLEIHEVQPGEEQPAGT